MKLPAPPLPSAPNSPALALAARLAAWRTSRRAPRALLWLALVALLLVAQTLLVALTLRYEEARAQERSDDVAAAALADIRRRTQMVLQGLQGLQHRFQTERAGHNRILVEVRPIEPVARVDKLVSVDIALPKLTATRHDLDFIQQMQLAAREMVIGLFERGAEQIRSVQVEFDRR